MKFNISCSGFKRVRKNTLRGFAVVRFDELKLVVSEIAVHESHDSKWAALPSRPWVADGRVIRGDDGKIKYQPLFEFESREVRDAFSSAVVAAVERFDAHAFEAE